MDVLIRRAEPKDAEPLSALKRATFRETFLEEYAIPYPPEDLAAFESAWYAPEAVGRELIAEERTTWVAERLGRGFVGYAQVGPCKLPHPDARPEHGELYQLYVQRAAHGTGVGRLLLDTALDHLTSTRAGPQWLGVWSGNKRAQALYAKRGFRPVGTYQLAVGTWHDDDLIFRRDSPPMA